MRDARLVRRRWLATRLHWMCSRGTHWYPRPMSLQEMIWGRERTASSRWSAAATASTLLSRPSRWSIGTRKERPSVASDHRRRAGSACPDRTADLPLRDGGDDDGTEDRRTYAAPVTRSESRRRTTLSRWSGHVSRTPRRFLSIGQQVRPISQTRSRILTALRRGRRARRWSRVPGISICVRSRTEIGRAHST